MPLVNSLLRPDHCRPVAYYTGRRRHLAETGPSWLAVSLIVGACQPGVGRHDGVVEGEPRPRVTYWNRGRKPQESTSFKDE